MSESSIVQLVRCPKCENLLQEPPDFSVYLCGGCGTVLRAKKNEFVINGDLDVSDEEKGTAVTNKVDDNATALVNDFREDNTKEGSVNEAALDINPPFPDNRGVATDLDVATRQGKNVGLRPSHDRFRHSQDVHNSNRIQDHGNSRSAYADSRFETERQEFMLLEGSMRARTNVNSKYVDRIRLVPSLSNGNDVVGKRGFVNFSYPDEGPSNHGVGSYGNHTEQAKYEDHMDRLARVRILENDRAELLRKLDELTVQLTGSCNVADVSMETRFCDLRIPPPSKTYDAVKQPGTGQTGHLSHGNSSYPCRNCSDLLESYPTRNHMQDYRGFGDVYYPHMLRRPPYYSHKSCYEHFNGDLLMPEPHETFHPKPTCSCMHPLNNNLYVPRQSQPPILSHQNDGISPNDRHPPLSRSSSDLGVESSGFGRWRLKTAPVVTKRDRRRVFHPIAGGAPFITCCNCSQVLKMSRKFLLTQEKQNKIKCEACSCVLLFEFEKKGFVLSVPAETDDVFADISVATHCNDYTNTGVTDTSDEFENRNVESNSCSGDSEDEPNLIRSFESTPKDDSSSLHLLESSCDKYLDKPFSDSGESIGKTSRQDSLKDALVATEIDVSFDDNSPNFVWQYSSDNSQPKINKMADSFILALFKKKFGDISKSRETRENRRSNVSVNGHFLTDRVVKKAEKLAGPIQPGDYWYDYRAGFWGVMGHSCLGIIMPNIDEFNYPVPENCAGGNTGIYLNGRELHQKDLDLLVSRGLPITSHKSYLIEISGRVVDEDTGDELDLGKLAPTVEKAKHGFGMKVPKTILKQ